MHLRTLVVWWAACLVAAGLFCACQPEIRNASPVGETIVCFGDSLTFGTGAPRGGDYPSRLAALLGQEVINAGVPGDTTAAALERLERDVLAYNPRIVLITLGGNDLRHRVPPQQAFGNLRRIIETIQERGALVIVGGIDIPLWGRGFDKGYREVCRQTGAVLVPDILDGILGHQALMSDPIHPNAEGYTRMAHIFYEALRPYL